MVRMAAISTYQPQLPTSTAIMHDGSMEENTFRRSPILTTFLLHVTVAVVSSLFLEISCLEGNSAGVGGVDAPLSSIEHLLCHLGLLASS